MNRAKCLRCCSSSTRFQIPARIPPFSRLFSDQKRHAQAPKPIIDIKHIRQNPALYAQNCIDRNYTRQATHPQSIIDLHTEWQNLQTSAKALRTRANLLGKGLASKSPSDIPELAGLSRDALQDEAKAIKAQLATISPSETAALAEIEALALELPNITSPDTPLGKDHEVLSYINEAPAASASTKSHVDIGTQLGILDFAAAAHTSGWGWYYLVGAAAQLEQALVQYALTSAKRHGWTQVSPPSMVYSHIGSACGFQPRDQHGEQQVYAVAQAAEDVARGVPAHVLAGTSEIPLAGMKANTELQMGEMPLKRVAVSRCYRAEAGARGASTKGLYRVHEFTKVEMFAWTEPHDEDVFEEMLDIQTEIIESLGLHARILAMPASDLGASAARKVDMEAWFPSRAASMGDGWGEVSSASMCTDYQARRLATRLRYKGDLGFPWTVNGTALAVPRVLAALLEAGWDENSGTVAIPECLRPWMDGMDKIGPNLN
ncbi:Putative Seryl-tRNA synthetase, class IIa [[Torrubiella] hemipterigena]|uniref:serine--tRNA ligase n=1 Tax=[Torrubiella] hemipterigena TaxID=1531966 RepID=A0A0A1TMW8_9HYPO|nr:Putative Seryl-tRNA synthetase, class IIa [[Torrubiella] hemipterigena]